MLVFLYLKFASFDPLSCGSPFLIFPIRLSLAHKKAARRPPDKHLFASNGQNGKNQGMATTLTAITSRVKGTPIRIKSANL